MIGQFTETLGQFLKQERESRSVTLEELSRATRISAPFLEALERDDFAFFSQREYLPGFLKGYARYLGLNVEEVLGRYRIQNELTSRKEKFQQISLFPGTTGPIEEIQDSKSDFPAVQQPPQSKRAYWKVVLQIMIVCVALGLSWHIHQLLKNSESRPKTPSEKGNLESPAMKVRPGSVDGLKGVTPREKRRVVANRERKIYSLPGMKEYGKVDPAQRVEFDSEEAAIKAGYRMNSQ